MSRIQTPATISEAPEASQAGLRAVEAQLGSVPNLFRLFANSPSALQGYIGLSGALADGKLSAATRERIALAVAEVNGCDYCLAAHSYLATNIAKLTGAEIAANRRGRSSDVKADAAVRFAVDVTRSRGQVSESAVQSVKSAGYTDAEVLEIIGHVALNTLTNYVNSALDTEIDFPVAELVPA